MMRSLVLFTTCIFIVTFTTFSNASDPSPLQDFCVSVNDSETTVFVNGKTCKDPKMVDAEDFFFSGLNKPRNFDELGLSYAAVNESVLPGLNTLGLFLARMDFLPYGLNRPVIIPRASVILVVTKGTLYVGFVASNPTDPTNYKLFAKTLYTGDVFAFPQGLIQFQYNPGSTNAVAFAFYNSQNPGATLIPNAVFGSNPPINPDVLTKSFQVDKKLIEYLQEQF